jgi:superoxide dismutase
MRLENPCRKQFADAANGEFGSGWAWLVRDTMGALCVTSSDDAENPLQRGARPLLALEVWEHTYYLDYRNERARYVENFLDQVVNWEFAAANLAEAMQQSSAEKPGGARPRSGHPLSDGGDGLRDFGSP